VTINLAPRMCARKDRVRSAHGTGLVGCQGQFFGKQLDKMMFLGELSLDGSVRSVRGALSRRWRRGSSVEVACRSGSQCEGSAVVEGVDVYALKSLPQAVDLVTRPSHSHRLKVDAQYSVDLRDVHGRRPQAGAGVACAGGHTFCSCGRRARGKPCWRSASDILPPMSSRKLSRRRASIA